MLRSFTTYVFPTERLDVVKADSTDNKVLECAVAAGSKVVVSGDKHLLDMREFREIPIVRVSDFLERLGARRR